MPSPQRTHPHLSNPVPAIEPGGTDSLRLLSYNIQTGIGTNQYRDYVLNGWKHVLPSADRMRNLDHIAGLLRQYDIVGLQETDEGSLRSHFLNQTEYLSLHSGLPHWSSRINRDLGHWGQHAIGLLAKTHPVHIEKHPLPGRIPGRGVLLADFDWQGHSLRVLVSHLSLSKRARSLQLDRLIELCQEHPGPNIVMADFNCTPNNVDLQKLCNQANLRLPADSPETYPNWRPNRAIDHILVSAEIVIESVEALRFGASDHAPLSMQIALQQQLKPRENAS
jgi:endonuclease/exonuclease/phosphatase family metal-dependent hydrolase